MKNIVLVLIVTCGLGFIGFAATMETAIQWQKKQSDRPSVREALDNYQVRLNYAMIGAGVGAAVGLLGSVGLLNYYKGRKRAGLPK
jgi:uncharacterized membrane protein YesL